MNLLLRRQLFKTVNKKSFFQCSSNTQKDVPPPALHPLELEPFKFDSEKDELLYGYTMEELYGRRYGVKHSEAIKSEMRKDSIMFVLLMAFGIGFLYKSRQSHVQMQQDWETYIYHDMNTVRPLRDKKPVQQSQ